MASQEEPTAGTPSTGTPSPTPSTSQTSCWECSRRRLVCDAARPTCAKCRAAGIVCPGYSNVKPLRWLAPGMVTTRVRKTKRKTASGSTKTTHRTSPSDATDSSYSDSSGSPEGGPSALVPLNKGGGAKRQDSELVHQPSVRLAWGLPRGIPRAEFRFEETTDILQATYYYNSEVFPEYIHHQLSPTAFVQPLPLKTVALIPPAMNHILVSVALRHRMYRVGANSGRRDRAVLEMRSKYYHHRGLAISAMDSDIRGGVTNVFVLMASAIMFVFAELQQSNASAWKYHMNAMMAMVSRAGGLAQICRIVEHMRLTMVLFVMIQVTGSTTSPPSSSTLPSDELGGMLEFVHEVWEESPYPTFLCPADILAAIMRINHLRSQLLDRPLSEADASPEGLLASLKAFSPEGWAATKTSSHEEWLLIARAHHSAAILYCMATLEEHFPRSSLQDLEILRVVHASTLFAALRQAEAMRGVRMGSLWPLIVAGVEAARENSATRSFVRRRFTGLADDLATPLMLEAKRVFEEFWASGKVGWGECFDKPYAFVL